MVKALIIEDESRSSNYLLKLLQQRDVEVIEQLFSVQEALDWFTENQAPELIFSDIQLGDGLAFDIFEQVSISSKIIFTTAYNEYSIQAFKHNSIDYLLKPIKSVDLDFAIQQFKNTKDSNAKSLKSQDFLLDSFKNIFLLKVGARLKTAPVTDMAYIFSENKMTYIVMKNGEKLIYDGSLERMKEQLDPKRFFQANRKLLVTVDCLKDILIYSNSRLKLILEPNFEEEVFVSRDRVKTFKNWLDR
jgi:DNA-binding LytR/AlgR family response regulator